MPRRKARKLTIRRKRKIVQKESFTGFKLPSSYTSLILGAIVVVVVAILFVIFAKGSRVIQTISTNENPAMDSQTAQDKSNTSSTYTIKPGDDLWSISETVFHDGYKWVEIAKINKLEEPGLIHAGNKLLIQTISPTVVQKEIITSKEIIPSSQSTIMQNDSITQNTYKIKPGDNLWDISVRAYGDGFKWPELAKVNNIEIPNLIYAGNVLKIPR